MVEERPILYNEVYPAYSGRSFGLHMTDLYERINMERMRKERLEKARACMREEGISVMLLLRPENIRYTTAYTTLGYKAGLACALVPQEGEPIVFGHGTCTIQERREVTWIKPENMRWKPKGGCFEHGFATDPAAREYQMGKFGRMMADALSEMKLSKEVVGLDMADSITVAALEKFGIRTTVKTDLMVKAQEIKTKDEIECFRITAAICDVVHYELAKYAEPGKTERELSGYMDFIAMKFGAEPTPMCFAASGPSTHPNHRYPTDRFLRPGDIFFADCVMVAFCGYKSCNYRSYSCATPPSQAAKDAYKRIIERAYDALSECKPGNTSADMAKHFPDEEKHWGVSPDYALGDNICHGLGIVQYGPPFASRAWSLKYPYELKEGHVFAIETQDGIGDGQGVRVEDIVVVTHDGYEVLTRAPYELITCPLR